VNGTELVSYGVPVAFLSEGITKCRNDVVLELRL